MIATPLWAYLDMPSIDESVNEKNTCWGASAVAEIFDKADCNMKCDS
jgi:hypothetical protein